MNRLKLNYGLLCALQETLINPVVTRKAILLAYDMVGDYEIPKEFAVDVAQAILLSVVNRPEDAVLRKAAYARIQQSIGRHSFEAALEDLQISRSEDPGLRRLLEDYELRNALKDSPGWSIIRPALAS